MRDREYAARLFLQWLNERYSRAFAPQGFESDVWPAADGDSRLAITVTDLYETDAAWDTRRAELCQRLDATRPGSYLLWLPPGGELPAEEPEESEWIRRVVLAASRLASGRSAEVRLPAKLTLAKVRDEGGYANVTGGLGRHWTTITQRLQGSFYIDSMALRRFTRDEEERQQLFEHIGLISQGVQTGEAVEFEHEDAWLVQRLPRGAAGQDMEDGWAITGCPPGFDPNDGGAIRRLLRARLAAAQAALKDAEGARTLVLVGPYDYIENENAGPALRGFDPSLVATFDIIALVAEGSVKPLAMNRHLPFGTATQTS
jgi:hypothetical protein